VFTRSNKKKFEAITDTVTSSIKQHTNHINKQQTTKMMRIPTILHNLFPSRSNSSSSVIVDGPSDNDVLCGRDRNFAKHPGNFLYRIQVERQASAYALATTKQAKMKITKAIVHIMQTQYGSRFLRRTENNLWEVLTNVQARDKTSHALRFINNSNGSNRSDRTDEESCEQVVPRDNFNESSQSNINHVSSTKRSDQTNDVLFTKNSDAPKNVVAGALTGGCMSHNSGPDEATVRAIHQRQQELLRSSLQNDNAMDVQGGTNMTIDQLMLCPLFSLSGIHPTNPNSMMMIESTRSMDNLGISDMQIMQYVEDQHHQPVQQQFHQQIHPSQPQLIQYYDDDVQQQFDSIRTRDMMDILNRPIDDTLRSEELNFLLEGSPMDDF
jgi:hypothetical protein